MALSSPSLMGLIRRRSIRSCAKTSVAAERTHRSKATLQGNVYGWFERIERDIVAAIK
jgi:hypothetical protein